MADSDAPKDAGIAINGHVVLDDGVTGYVEHIAVSVLLEALRAERYALIECHVTADDTGLANNHSCTMINGKVFAYLCAWMDVDASF